MVLIVPQRTQSGSANGSKHGRKQSAASHPKTGGKTTEEKELIQQQNQKK
jgi:hypothetical protein